MNMYIDDCMKVETYKEVYKLLVSISCDADGYGLFDKITEEDIEKCKWIYCMYEVMTDVPLSRMNHVFKYKKINFDRYAFLEENEV